MVLVRLTMSNGPLRAFRLFMRKLTYAMSGLYAAQSYFATKPRLDAESTKKGKHVIFMRKKSRTHFMATLPLWILGLLETNAYHPQTFERQIAQHMHACKVLGTRDTSPTRRRVDGKTPATLICAIVRDIVRAASK